MLFTKIIISSKLEDKSQEALHFGIKPNEWT